MRYPVVMPDLGLAETPMALSQWLVEIDDEVIEGEGLVEVIADSVAVSLPAEVSGVLSETLVVEDDALHVGQILGYIEDESAEEADSLDEPDSI